MTKKEIIGGWYGDALPSGEFAVLKPPTHIETHLGSIPLPGENVLFIRITNIGGFKIAGQGGGTGIAWEYSEGAWHNRGTTFGVSPVIYDNAGTLVLALPKDGSQGFRYVGAANNLVTGDQTYKHPALPLWEYSEAFGFLIGQGENGCQVTNPLSPILRILEPGDCRFIRVQQNGGIVTITIVKMPENKTVIYWMSPNAFATLPLAIQPPAPSPVLPPPVKDPLPVMPIAPNKLDIVQQVINAHPEIARLSDGPFAPNRGGITHLVVQALGGFPWGRKSKDRSATNLSDDALCFRTGGDEFEIYDILSGTDGAAQWDFKGAFKDGANGWFQTVTVDSTQPVPTPQPTPTPIPLPIPNTPPVNLTPLLDRLDAQAALLEKLTDHVTILTSQVTALQAQLAKGFDGKVRVFGSVTTFQINPRV